MVDSFSLIFLYPDELSISRNGQVRNIDFSPLWNTSLFLLGVSFCFLYGQLLSVRKIGAEREDKK